MFRATSPRGLGCSRALQVKLFDPNLVDVLKLTVLGDDLRSKLWPIAARADRSHRRRRDHRASSCAWRSTGSRSRSYATERRGERAQGRVRVVVSEVISEADSTASSCSSACAPPANALPFVFLSHRAESEMRSEGLRAGADDFITKPGVARGGCAQDQPRAAEPLEEAQTGGVSGSLTEMSLPDWCRSLSRRKSGKLAIRPRQARRDPFCDGQIYDAMFVTSCARRASTTCCFLSDGDFELDPHVQADRAQYRARPREPLLEACSGWTKPPADTAAHQKHVFLAPTKLRLGLSSAPGG